MKKIYIEKIRQAIRFGLIDEDGRKIPCGTLWSDAQRETFERLMNGGNNLAFMAWDSNGGKKSALWAKWTDEDVWEFLHHYGCEGNPLYKCGYSRVGCIGCPMAGGKKMKKELEQYPKYAQMYFRATDRMLKRRMEQGKELPLAWGDGKPETVMKWWLEP